jgi:hypothetical protein
MLRNWAELHSVGSRVCKKYRPMSILIAAGRAPNGSRRPLQLRPYDFRSLVGGGRIPPPPNHPRDLNSFLEFRLAHGTDRSTRLSQPSAHSDCRAFSSARIRTARRASCGKWHSRVRSSLAPNAASARPAPLLIGVVPGSRPTGPINLFTGLRFLVPWESSHSLGHSVFVFADMYLPAHPAPA